MRPIASPQPFSPLYAELPYQVEVPDVFAARPIVECSKKINEISGERFLSNWSRIIAFVLTVTVISLYIIQ